jgi:hypothetical protein
MQFERGETLFMNLKGKNAICSLKEKKSKRTRKLANNTQYQHKNWLKRSLAFDMVYKQIQVLIHCWRTKLSKVNPSLQKCNQQNSLIRKKNKEKKKCKTWPVNIRQPKDHLKELF